VTFHFVAFAWIFFRAETFAAALAVIAGIATAPWLPAADLATFGALRLPATGAALVGLALLHGLATLAVRSGVAEHPLWHAARPFAYAAVMIACLLFANTGAQQFIYFQF
jgi:hypothetical protein